MKILVTGASGFIGKNLIASLRNIRNNTDITRRNLQIDEIFECDKDTDLSQLDSYCAQADFIYHLAGVDWAETDEEFMNSNYGFASMLLDTLKQHGNPCPVMLASSVQAASIGQSEQSAYGKSKYAAEELFFAYHKEVGAQVLVYRFPNIFGKWCRPNCHSTIADFCNNIANDCPVQVDDRNVELDLLYVDDLIEELLDALDGKAHRCDYEGQTLIPAADGSYCFVPVTHRAALGEIADLLLTFKNQPKSLVMPAIPNHSFAKKLYSTYLSYLPKREIVFPLKMNADDQGSSAELLKMEDFGRFSVDISKPGVTKGQHWHSSKWQLLIVVAGHGLIEERKIGTDEVMRFEVSGEKIEAVHILPGYAHKIINLSETEDLVTFVWTNEQFDPDRPDTFCEEV